MDEQVRRAMARWPDVPAVYGWLRLDRRGRWLLVDRGQPGFDETRDAAGSPITNAAIVDFIDRNYACDERGRWFWQNGPQRVYVDLEIAPLILRTIGDAEHGRFVAHTGAAVTRVEAGWIGPQQEILLETDLGPAAVHDLDAAALPLTEDGDDIVLQLPAGAIALRPTESPALSLGFVAAPRP